MPGFLLCNGKFEIGLGVCSMGLYRTGSSQTCHARFAVDEGGDSGAGSGDGEDDSVSCVLEAPVSMVYGERGLVVKRDRCSKDSGQLFRQCEPPYAWCYNLAVHTLGACVERGVAVVR